MITENKIFKIKDDKSFNETALKIFQEQYKTVDIYKKYIDHINVDPLKIDNIKAIPFLPIRFFKSHEILAEGKQPEITFLSSGTTQSNKSKHLVFSIEMYKNSFLNSFKLFYGDISSYTILALLPSYQEQQNSSLIFMVNQLIKLSNNESTYISSAEKKTMDLIHKLKNKKVLLIGVSYALLDLAEKVHLDLSNWVIMETGGMKGRRKEITRKTLHNQLNIAFNTKNIHSEYGMTELLSQAYSKKNGIFHCPPWMRVLTRGINDPFSYNTDNKTGGINIIDLANLHSCSFIATDDLGKVSEDRSFEILGRFDQSDTRGCNLLMGN